MRWVRHGYEAGTRGTRLVQGIRGGYKGDKGYKGYEVGMRGTRWVQVV